MDRDTIQTTDTEGSQTVLMLQPSELTLNSGTAPVEVAPPLRLTGNQRVEAGRLAPERLRLALALVPLPWALRQRAAREMIATLEAPVDAFNSRLERVTCDP